MPENDILYTVRLSDGRTDKLTQPQYEAIKDKLFTDDANAEVIRTSVYDPKNTDLNDSDVFQVKLSDGRTDNLTRAQFEKVYEPLKKDYPDAQVYQISNMSDRYWRPKLEEAQAALSAFDQANGDFMAQYEADRRNATSMQRGIGAATLSDAQRSVAENHEKYDSLTKERQALGQAIYNNPLVKSGRQKAYEDAMSKRDEYLNLAEKTEDGSERRDWKRAAKLLGDAAELYAAPGQFDDTEKNGFAKYLDDYKKGAVNTFSDRDFWTRGLTQISRDFDLHGIRKKVQDAEKAKGRDLDESDYDRILTPSEKAELMAFYNLAYAQADETIGRAKDLSSAYRAGGSAADSVGFMAEFALGTGIGNVVGKAILKGSTNAFARWMGEALMSQKAQKTAIEKGILPAVERTAWQKVGRTAGQSFVNGAARATVSQPLGTLSNIASKMNETNDAGELNSIGRGIWLGFGDAFIEDWSESFGNTIDGVFGIVGDKIGKLGGQSIRTDFGKMARWAVNSNFSKSLAEAGFNGFVGEMLEEWFGNAARLATGLMNKDKFKQFATVHQQLEMAASFGPMSMIGIAGQARAAVNHAKEYERLSEETKKILLKNGVGQPEIDAIFKQKWATSEDIANAIAPYAVKIKNSGLDSAQEDYRELLKFTSMAGVKSMDDAVEEVKNEERRNQMRDVISAHTGQQFWQDYDSPEAKDAEGNPVKIHQVRVIQKANGTSLYVVAGENIDDAGNRTYATIDDGGAPGFINDQQIAEGLENGSILSDREMMLDDYLQEQVDAVAKDEEAKRMQQETLANLTALQNHVATNGTINIGTIEAPIEATVVPESITAQGVTVTYKTENGDAVRPLTWSEVANYVGMPFYAKTDAELDYEAAEVSREAGVRKDSYNKIPIGTPVTLMLDEETPETHHFAKAVHEESEDFVRIYLTDEKGEILTDADGNEQWFPESMIQGIDQLAEQYANGTIEDNQNPAPENADEDEAAGSEPTPPAFEKYVNEKTGKVNQTAFMNNEPEEWAKWNDARRNDNGIATKRTLAAAINTLDKDIAQKQKELDNEPNPDEADAKEEALGKLVERRNRLNAIYGGYIAQEEAIREADAAARRAEVEAAAAAKKEEERKAAAKIQDDLKEDAGFVDLAETYANQKKTYGDSDTYNVGGRKFKGRWVVAEATTPKPSHNSLNDFAPTPGYPIGKAGNSNHYDKDKRAQEITREMSNPFDERAVQEPVVVTKHGIVLSGNGRTQARLLAAQQQTDADYKEYIREHASKWGLTAGQVDEYANPILYFELEEDVEYTAGLFDAFNRSTSKQQSVTETASKVAQMTSEELVMRLDRLFREIGDNIDNLYKNPKLVNDLLNMLEAAGIFNANERARYVDEYGNLSGAGEDLVESVLFGTIFSSSDESVRAAMNDKAIRRAVAFAFPTLVRLRSLSGEFSLINEMTDAVSLLAIAKADNGGKADNAIIDYMLQADLWSGETPVVKATVQLLAQVLNRNTYGSLRAVLNQYIERAEAANYGQAVFTEEGDIEVESKERILRDVLAHNNINIEAYGNTAAEPGVSANDEVRPASGEQGSIGDGTVGAGESNPAGVQGEGNPAEQVASEGPADILEIAKEQAKKNRKLQKILKRVEKWKKFLGDASFEIATGIEDIENIADEATRQQVLARQQEYGDVEGWFANGKAVIYLPNIPDQRTLDRKIMHEVISHKGIKGLFEAKGEGEFDKFCDWVWGNLMNDAARSKYLNYPGVVEIKNLSARQRAAADEFLAHCAENETAVIAQLDEDFWSRLIDKLKSIINDAMGEDVFKGEDDNWFESLLKEAAQSVQQDSATEQEDTGALFSVSEDYAIPRERISQNLDQNNRPFILNSKGSEEFGLITASQNLPAAPIKLSLGDGENGLIHIENRHGKEIRDAGYDDILSFIEYVAENFTDIREGNAFENEQGGENQSYLLQLTDEHNNTLFVQLSRDGKYWNINSAGVFAKKYGKKKKSIWSASSRQIGSSATSSSALQSEPNTDNGSTSKGTAPNVSRDKSSESSSNLQVSDIKNDEQEGTVLYSIKEKNGNKSLVGIHNISERKLAAAVKTGGLANPSMAVIDLDFQKHEDFGEISLIAPSSLIDSYTGDNSGTYTGDAWTPTYPSVSKQMSDKGWDKFFDDVRDLPYPFDHQIRNDWREYLDDDRMGRSLHWWFLRETGKNPEIIYNSVNLSDADREIIKSTEGKKLSEIVTDETLWPKVVDLYKRLGDPAEVKSAQEKKPIKEGRGNFTAWLEARNSDIDDWGIWTRPVFDLVENLQRRLRSEGTVAEIATYQAADKYIEDNNLSDAFDQWLQDKEKEYGTKSVLFAGWTRDGDRKYVANTVENASRLMNKEPKQNSYGDGGVNATRSLLLDRMDTLFEIRKNRGMLGEFEGYAHDTEEYKEATDNWFNVINTLAQKQKVDDNQFINIDIAEARLQEAIQERDPIAYLNREYRYGLTKDGEFAKALKASLKEIKALPAKYFETKFNRPVYLNEFAAAVVPSDARADVRKELEKAGLPIFEYDSKVEGSRKDAVMKASEGEGVRFSVVNKGKWPAYDNKNLTPRVMEEMDRIREATIAGSIHMKAPNGKVSNLSETNWLLVRTNGFKNFFGDWELAALLRDAQKAWESNYNFNYGFIPSDRLKARFNELLGHDVNSVHITGDSVRHFKSNHSKDEELRGQVNLSAEDTILIPYLMNNYDTMELDPGNNKGERKAVIISKRINGVSIIGTLETGKDKEYVITGWRFKGSDVSMQKDSAPKPNVQDDSEPSLAKVKNDIENIKRSARNVSRIVDNNGEPAVVFHGSNWNPLDEPEGEAVFNDSYRGTGSGDNGFFGRGFYFTYQDGTYFTSEGARAEAGYYGRNITEVFLNIRNPFMFNETLYQFNGKDNIGSEKESVIILNMVKNFPELVKDYRIDVIDSEGNESGEITLEEYAKIFEDTYKNKEFIIRENADETDSNIVELCADPVHHEEVINGHKVEWNDYGFRMPMYKPSRNEDAQLAYTHYYLTYLNDMWREDHTGAAYNFPSHMFSELFESEEFTQALKDKGYDGVLQSAYGDEAVAFQPEQIKSATAGNGEFSESKDIRFSVKDYAPIRADQTQTKAFKDWFDGSKIVNEDGSPMVVYRGASFDPLAQEPGMGIIKPQRYFSPDKEYAEIYSSLGGATRAYYLNIKNPLDVRNKKDYDLINSLIPWREPHIGGTGALDWSELSAFDLDELIEQHPEYDGIVLDEGGHPDGKGGVHTRGISYMPFFGGNQVKSATHNNGEFSEHPDVRFSVKRYRDFTIAQQAQKVPGAEYPSNFSIVRFSLSNRNRTTVNAWLSKRKDLTDDQRKVVVDYLDQLSNPKLQLATAKWFAKGVIRLPEDMPKVEQAVTVADRAKVDPLQYDSPMELIEAHADIEIKEKPINPDKVSTLHKAAEYKEHGVVIYDVDDTEESRENMRKIINTHFGKEASPWCLLQGDGNGKLTDESARYWRHYNGYQKQVAFKDGKLLAFSANDREKRLWWDRQDRPSEGIPVSMKMPNDELGRSAMYNLDSETGELGPAYDIHRGNQQNGTWERWSDDGAQQLCRIQFKNGKRHGLSETWHRSNGKPWIKEEYFEGRLVGDSFSWYDNGNLWTEKHRDNKGLVQGAQTEYHENGQMSMRWEFKNGLWDGLKERWNPEGVLVERTEFKEGVRHGLEETWYNMGERKSSTHYDMGLKDGLMEEWWLNGNKRSEINYSHDLRVGTSRTWYESGNPKSIAEYNEQGDPDGEVILYNDNPGDVFTREHWKDGGRHGLSEQFWPGNRLRLRENWKNGERDGLSEQWHENGVLTRRQMFKGGKADGIVERWDSGGKLWDRTEFKDGKEVRFLGNYPNESVYDTGVKFSVVTDKDELDRLEKEPTVTLYRAMELIDGELYPPMSQKVPNAKEDRGKKLQRREGVRPGMWQKADEDPGKAYQKEKGGPWYYDLKKIDSKQSDTNGVLYNPYIHLSASPLNDQFSAASKRPNLVTVACEVPVSELTSGYKAEKANDSVGPKDWHSGTVTAQLGEGRQVVLSRWAKISRIVPDSEVAAMVAPKLVAKNITVPANVVTPSLRAALESHGVKFAEPETHETDTRFSLAGMQEETFYDTDGNAIRFAHEGGLPEQGGRTSLVERTYSKRGDFSFTGRDKIGNVYDVAYIFKELETAAVENSFIVFVKDGLPTILHTGIGSINHTTIDHAAVIAGYSDYHPDEVYMVHNHPSGNVQYSKADLDTLGAIQKQLGKDVEVTGVIIDTLSGEFGVFYPTGELYHRDRAENVEGEVPIEVMAFDKMVFSPEYRRDIKTRIRSKEDVASYISAHRLGNGPKIGALLLNNNANVTGNLVLPTNELTQANAEDVARQIVDAAVHTGANRAALFGDFAMNTQAIKALRVHMDNASGKQVSLVDVVRVEGNYTKSLADGTLMDSGQNKKAPASAIPGDGSPFKDSTPFGDTRFSVANTNQKIFISNAEMAVSAIPMGKATPDQWLKMIESKGGLKAGEDKWIGLSDWLKASDKKSITKQEVLDYIDENKIQIDEEHYIDQDNSAALQSLQEEFNTIPYDDPEYMLEEADKRVAEFYWEMEEKYGENFEYEMTPSERGVEDTLLDERERWIAPNAPDGFEAAYNAMVEKYGDDFSLAFTVDDLGRLEIVNEEAASFFLGERPINQTRLYYTTAGLKNKREIALTVPTIDPWNENDDIHFGDAGEGRAVAWIRFGDATARRELTEAEREQVRERIGDAKSWRKLDGSQFVNKHDLYIPNDVMHTNTRVVDMGNGKYRLDILEKAIGVYDSLEDAVEAYKELRLGGEKRKAARVMVIDEIQSKRHQDAREKGYSAQSELQERNRIIADKMAELPRDSEEYQRLEEEFYRNEKERAKIPAAPFEKNWHELAMKRMLRLAAEEGYDYVAWTTGEQQAERYDIGTMVKYIEATESYREDAYKDIYANGEHIASVSQDGTILGGENAGKPLSELVGKELAAKLMVDGKVSLSGESLRIGGEGMKGFYDDILPRFMNKYGKKWGVKVEDISLPDVYDETGHPLVMHSVKVTPEMKESVMQGQVMFSVSSEAAEKAHVGGIGAVIGNENVTDFYMDVYKGLPAEMRRDITERAMSQGLSFRSTLRDYITDLAGTGNNDTGVLGMAESMLNYYAGVSLDPNDARYILWRGERKENEGDLLDVAHDQFMRRHLGIGEQKEGARFSLKQDLDQAELTADVTVDNGKRELDSAKKNIKKEDPLRMIKGMNAQKEYDRRTVDALTNLAKDLLRGQYIDSMNRREIARLLGIIKTSIGKSPKVVKKNADALIKMVIDNLLARERDGLKRLTSITGSKTNATGVEVQGTLDVQGQKTLKAYKEGITHDVGSVDDDDTMNTLYGMRARLIDRLESKDDAVRKDAEAEDAGLALAIEYKEGIKELQDEEKAIRDEIKDYDAQLKEGNMSKSMHKENVEAAEDAIRENQVGQIEAYRAFRAKMQEMMSGSVEAKKSFIEQEKERKAQIQHLANSDMQGRKADADSDVTKTFWGKLANSAIVRFFAAPLGTFDQMLRLFGGKNVAGEGYLWNKFMRDWQDATANAYIGQRDAKAELDKKVSQVFGRDMRWGELFDEERSMPRATIKWMNADGQMQEHELTQGQLLYIYMVNKMADGRMKLRKMGIMQEHVDAIKKQMDERFLKLADWLQGEYLVNLRNKYNAIHERLFGASMAAIEDYFPLVINKRGLNKQEDIASADYESLPSTTTGSIIKRRRNNKALDLLNADAFSVVLDHIDQMEQWAAFAEFNKDVNTLLSYKRFRNQVQNMASVYGAGKTFWQNFKDVCRIAGNSYHPSVKKDSLDSAAVNLAKGVTSAKISFRVFTALKQFLSMPAFVADANIIHLGKNLANPMGAWKWAMENLPLFEKRWKSRIAGDTRLMTTEMDWKIFRSKVYQKLSQLGMTPNAFVDAWTVAVGAHSMYQTKYDRYIKDGYSEEQADKRAKQDATVLYNETQQSNENAFLSTVQLDRTLFATSISVFRNSSMGYQRQLHDAVRNLGKMMRPGYKEQSIAFMTKQMIRDGLTEEQAASAAERRYNRSLTRNAVRAATFGFLVEFAWNLGGSIVYLLFGDDDDEKDKMLADAFKKAITGGTMEGLAGGNVLSDALDMVRKGENLRNYDPTLLPIISDMKRVYSMMSYDWVSGTHELVNLAVQAGIGVNPQTIEDVVTAVIDASNGDLDTSKEAMLLIMRVLQVPQSQIDQIYIDELGASAADAQKMSPRQMAKRYAEYKVNRGAGLMREMYPEELEKKRKKAYEKRFKNMVKEREELAK